MVEIQRILGGTSTAAPATSEADEANNLDEKNIEVESDTVQGYWKISQDGSLKKNKSKFYKSDSLNSLPKKSLYFHEVNSGKKDAKSATNKSVSLKKKV